MTLYWTFSFIRVDPNKIDAPVLEKVYSFKDGKPTFSISIDNYLMLLNYIAFFPDKDFTKIKLDLSLSQQYLVHFLDKRYLDNNFLGVLTVNEFNVSDPFELWGVEEPMAEYTFEYYQDLLLLEDKTEEERWNLLYDWLIPQMEDFYLDWGVAKKDFDAAKSKHSRVELADVFAQMASANHDSLQGKKVLETLSSTVKSKPTDDTTNGPEQWWDIQLINEFGQPLTDLISFMDGDAFILDDDTQMVSQNLESMSLSALKILIEQQGGKWFITYMKMRLRNEMGYQYTFFHTLSIGDVKFLLIMNSANYDPKDGMCIQIFRGNEIMLLEKVAAEITSNATLFTTEGLLKDPENQTVLRDLIVKSVSSIFSH